MYPRSLQQMYGSEAGVNGILARVLSDAGHGKSANPAISELASVAGMEPGPLKESVSALIENMAEVTIEKLDGMRHDGTEILEYLIRTISPGCQSTNLEPFAFKRSVGAA